MNGVDGGEPGARHEGMSRPIRRVLSWAIIHLGCALPCTSSDLPVRSGGQPSGAHCLVLLRVGFT